MARDLVRSFVSSPLTRRRWRRYLDESRKPLTSLFFLLIPVLLYQFSAGGAPRRDLVAHSLLQQLLAWFGFAGTWGPPVVLIAALLIWHAVKRERWRVRIWMLPAMLLESLVLTIPLLVLGALFRPGLLVGGAALSSRVVRALSAGIYEELIFRLLVISAVAWLATEIFRVPRPLHFWVAATVGAFAFAWAHVEPLGAEQFHWNAFGFRLAAGGYLALVFLGRGFGLAAGSHAAYNALLVLLRGT
jgi:hypothetical protein